MNSPSRRWRHDGVRVIGHDQLDDATAQTLGMRRRAAVTTEKTGATKLWAGTVTIDAKAKTGAHHHGELESVIYVVSGIARLRWGEQLEFVAEAGPGDFIYVPPWVPHQEINASDDLQLQCVLARSGQQGLVVNLDITPVELPELVRWIDDLHKRPGAQRRGHSIRRAVPREALRGGADHRPHGGLIAHKQMHPALEAHVSLDH
jgi:uncharacterized RmlC-like cupin family protein